MTTDWRDLVHLYDEKQGDEGDLWHREALDPPLFDLAICQMSLMDIADAAAVREVARTLRPAERLVAQFLHPCFHIPEASSWVVERMGTDTTVWRKVRRYREPFQGRVYWREGNDLIYTASYHRPLSRYVRALREAGLALTALEEPMHPAEFLAQRQDGLCLAEIPLHCLIEARKLQL